MGHRRMTEILKLLDEGWTVEQVSIKTGLHPDVIDYISNFDDTLDVLDAFIDQSVSAPDFIARYTND